MGCNHSPFEIFLNFPPLSWIIDAWIDFSVDREFRTMTAKGYHSYIGARYDKHGELTESGVVLWEPEADYRKRQMLRHGMTDIRRP
jgi:hypothetical protein